MVSPNANFRQSLRVALESVTSPLRIRPRFATYRSPSGGGEGFTDATSKDCAVAVKMHTHHGHESGAILVEWKGLLLGIEVRDDGAKPVLKDARAWFEKSN